MWGENPAFEHAQKSVCLGSDIAFAACTIGTEDYQYPGSCFESIF